MAGVVKRDVESTKSSWRFEATPEKRFFPSRELCTLALAKEVVTRCPVVRHGWNCFELNVLVKHTQLLMSSAAELNLLYSSTHVHHSA